jgi:twitching motility protein PilT
MSINDLLRYLNEKGGSDLHLMCGLPAAIRRNGHLEHVEGAVPFNPDTIRELIYEILTPEQIGKFESDPNSRYELDFAHGISGVGRFRFNVHRQRGTVGAVARSISTKIPSIDSLGLPQGVMLFTQVSKGLSLVTGPTGSGKSTTLASIIDYINSNRCEHILTIEDPIEYIHNSKKSYVRQREVGADADTLSFRNALKYALRQDPDIILVGEMRDYDTIGIAITSAETGHLVFGTLHTPSAAQTIGRIIDVFPSDQQPKVITQLSSNLVGVCSQILLPRADGKGRVAAIEFMKANAAVKNQIRSNSIDGIYQSIQTGAKEGMITMDQSLLNHVRNGAVTYEAARPHVRDEVTKRQLEEFRGRNGSGANGGGHEAESEPATAAVNAMKETVTQAEAPKPAEPAPQKRGFGAIIPPWEKK